MLVPVVALALGAIVALYGWLLSPQLGKPLVYDDVNFALGAQAIARTGLPYGNQGYLLHLYNEQDQWALWHPPLYLYSLGLTFALFGTTEVAARGLGVTYQLLSATLAFDIARRLLPATATAWARAAAGMLAVALFLLGPLTVQAALILDIDNTALMLLVTLFVWLVLRLPARWTPKIIASLAVLYTVTLWAKLTTPLLLLAALTFTRLFQGTSLRGALEALVVGVLGWALFLVSWTVLTMATGMSFDYTFTVATREALDSGASTRDRFVSWNAFVNGVAPAILWIGPFFCLLFVAAGLPRLWRLLRGRGLEPGDLVVVLGAAIYLVYIVKLAGGFPKYHAAMLPFWAAASAALAVRSAGRPNRGQLAVGLLGGLAATLWLAGHVAETWELRFSANLVGVLVGVPFLIGAVIAVLWAWLGRATLAGSVPVALTVLTLAWSAVLNVHHRQGDGSTGYYYGRWGQDAAARALTDRVGPDELYIASKEVAWYVANQRYVDQESWQHVVWDVNRGTWDGTWLGWEVRLLALEVGDEWWRATYERALLPRYRLWGEHGNFILLERTP